MQTIAIEQPVNPIVLGIPSFDIVSWKARNWDQPVRAAKPPAAKKTAAKKKAAPAKKKK